MALVLAWLGPLGVEGLACQGRGGKAQGGRGEEARGLGSRQMPSSARRPARGRATQTRPRPSKARWQPARTVQQVWRPGTERMFRFYGPDKGGRRPEAGWNWCRYEGRRTEKGLTGHLLHCKVHLDSGKLGSGFATVLESESWLLMDDRAVPLRMWGRTNLAGAFDLEFGPHEVHVRAAGRKLKVPWPGGIPVVANNHPVHEELLLALVGPRAGEKIAFDFFSPSGALVLPYEASVSAVGATRGNPHDTSSTLRITNSLHEVIVWGRDGILEATAGPGGLMRYESVEPAEPKLSLAVGAEPPKYRRPKGATWREIEVRVPGRDVPIAGTLRVPNGEGRHPAVLFISGSGSQDRNGIAGMMDLGTWQLLDHLARAGFAVLSTDDRGSGKTPIGKKLDIGYWDLVADAEAALEFLAGRPEVRRDRVFVIGHSEGAMTAVILAAKHPDLVAGLVLMAGPARNLAEVIRDQMVNLQLRGVSRKEAAERLASFDALVAALRAGKRPPKQVMTDTEWKASSRTLRWLSDHLRLDFASYLRKVRCPVLICQGGKDVQVSPERDARRLLAMLRGAGNRDVTLRIFPNLDHLFKLEPGRSSMESYMDRTRRLDPEFLRTVSGWLVAHAK